jgi:hypothetical protein
VLSGFEQSLASSNHSPTNVTADGPPALRRGTSGRALHDGVSFGETDPMVMNMLLSIVFGLIAGVVSTHRP